MLILIQADFCQPVLLRLLSHVMGMKMIMVMINIRDRGLSYSQPYSEVKWRLKALAQVGRFRRHTFALVQKTLRGPQER